MLTGTVVWLLVKAHRDALTGCLTIRDGDRPVRVHCRGQSVVAVEGVPALLAGLTSKLPSPAALTGELSADIPVCMALGLALDDILNAACDELGETIARLAQDPAIDASFEPDAEPPPGAFPLPRKLLRCFQDGLRAVRDADLVVTELSGSLDNPMRVTASAIDLDDLGTIALRTAKLARTEGTLRGLIAASGRGQPERTREAWFAVDLLLQLGLVSVQGAPVVRRVQRDRSQRTVDGERLSERIVQPRAEAPPPPPPPPRRTRPTPPRRQQLESDDEASDVFAMGAEDDEDDEDDDSSDEDSLDIAVGEDGASHVVSFIPGRKRERPRKLPDPPPTNEVAGGLHESDDDAADVFAMGGDDDLEELDEDSIEYLEDDEEWDDDDLEELGEDSIDALGEDPDEDWDDDEDDEDEEEETDDDESSVFQEVVVDIDVEDLEGLPMDPEHTSPGDPVALLDSPQAAPLVERFRALRVANPLVVLGYTEQDVRGYITLADLRKRANKEKGRWHPERYVDQGGDAQEAAAELNSLVDRRYEALKQPRVLAAAMREWREQLESPAISEADRTRATELLTRARQQTVARAWTAALMTIEEALEADPTNLRCRLLDLRCRVVLEEFDVESAVANIDALLITDVKMDSEAQLMAGLVLKHAGHPDARNRLERALELDPDNAAARHELDFDKAGESAGIGGIISGLFGGD